MLSDLELMNFHVRALFTHNARSRLLFVNEPGGAIVSASRLFLGRTRDGNIWRFRADLPEDLIKELNAVCAEEPSNAVFNEPPRNAEKYARLLEKHAPVERLVNNLTYHFPQSIPPPSKLPVVVSEENAEILRGGFEKLVEELPTWQPFVAVVEENRAVSICRSARITAEAHEAGVETLPDFRGKAYAKDATAHWALLVRAAGAVPLYSTSCENRASQAVARKLQLRCFGANFQIT